MASRIRTRIFRSRKNKGYYWFTAWVAGGTLQSFPLGTWAPGTAAANPLIEPVTWASNVTQLGAGSFGELTIRRVLGDVFYQPPGGGALGDIFWGISLIPETQWFNVGPPGIHPGFDPNAGWLVTGRWVNNDTGFVQRIAQFDTRQPRRWDIGSQIPVLSFTDEQTANATGFYSFNVKMLVATR